MLGAGRRDRGARCDGSEGKAATARKAWLVDHAKTTPSDEIAQPGIASPLPSGVRHNLTATPPQKIRLTTRTPLTWPAGHVSHKAQPRVTRELGHLFNAAPANLIEELVSPRPSAKERNYA